MQGDQCLETQEQNEQIPTDDYNDNDTIYDDDSDNNEETDGVPDNYESSDEECEEELGNNQFESAKSLKNEWYKTQAEANFESEKVRKVCFFLNW